MVGRSPVGGATGSAVEGYIGTIFPARRQADAPGRGAVRWPGLWSGSAVSPHSASPGRKGSAVFRRPCGNGSWWHSARMSRFIRTLRVRDIARRCGLEGVVLVASKAVTHCPWRAPVHRSRHRWGLHFAAVGSCCWSAARVSLGQATVRIGDQGRCLETCSGQGSAFFARDRDSAGQGSASRMQWVRLRFGPPILSSCFNRYNWRIRSAYGMRKTTELWSGSRFPYIPRSRFVCHRKFA